MYVNNDGTFRLRDMPAGVATSGTVYQCWTCGMAVPQDAPHECPGKAGPRPGTGWLDGIGTVRACVDCGVLVAGGPTRCIPCARKVPIKYTVEYDDTDAAPVPVWLALRDLPPGAIFETEAGTQAVKSEYRLQPEDPASPALCIIIGSGEFFHGDYGDDTVVCQIG